MSPESVAIDFSPRVPESVEIKLRRNSQGEEVFCNQMIREMGENDRLVSEYVNDIYAYLRQLETQYPVRPQHLVNQTEINGRMRGILIDWIVQVHKTYCLQQETLYLTVAIIDRYLQVRVCCTS